MKEQCVKALPSAILMNCFDAIALQGKTAKPQGARGIWLLPAGLQLMGKVSPWPAGRPPREATAPGSERCLQRARVMRNERDLGPCFGAHRTCVVATEPGSGADRVPGRAQRASLLSQRRDSCPQKLLLLAASQFTPTPSGYSLRLERAFGRLIQAGGWGAGEGWDTGPCALEHHPLQLACGVCCVRPVRFLSPRHWE